MMDDLISRQAAIDAVRTWDQGKAYLPIEFRELVEGLPSVESEIAKEIEKDCTKVMEGAVRIANALAEILESIWREDDEGCN